MLVWLYYLIRGIVGEERFAEIERLIMLNAQTQFIPKTAFEREQYQQAVSKGKAESVLAVLAARDLEVSEEERSTILTCRDSAKLDRLVARAVSTSSVAELLSESL